MMINAPRLLFRDTTTLTAGDRATHSYVIGQPGTGKSRALESWIMQDVSAGNGVGVIDPHGELFDNLVARLSRFPSVWDRIVIIDPCSPNWVSTFNPLGAISGISEERLSLFLTDIVSKIWKLDIAEAPRTRWLLTNSFLALAKLGMNLLDLPRFLLDRDFREGLLPRLANSNVEAYFRSEFPRGPAAAHQWATPVLNKIGGLIFDPDTSLMLAGEATINFRSILHRRLILLVNLPKGVIGEGASSILGAFIVAHIQKASLARTNTTYRPPFYLYLDEFQNYTTDNVIDILSESRKYALSLTLVNQYLDQLSSEMRKAVLNTAGSIACFRVGHSDGSQLAKEIFPTPDFLERFENRINFQRRGMGFLSALVGHPDDSGWEALAQTLVGLPQREFWFRRRGPGHPARHRTFDMPLVRMTPEGWERVQAMLDISGSLHSRPKGDVREQAKKARATGSPEPKADDGSGIWGV
jgi:hypothetical protein